MALREKLVSSEENMVIVDLTQLYHHQSVKFSLCQFSSTDDYV